MNDSPFVYAVVTAIAFLVGLFVGHIVTQDAVREDCKRQGSFYFGKDDFKCEVKK